MRFAFIFALLKNVVLIKTRFKTERSICSTRVDLAADNFRIGALRNPLRGQ